MRALQRGLVLALGASVAVVPATVVGDTASGDADVLRTVEAVSSPAPRNCFYRSDGRVQPPRITDAVHVAGDGRATIAWITPTGVVMSATQDGAGAWGAAEPVSGTAAVDSLAPVLAGDAAGDLVLGWVRDGAVQVALRPAGGAWSAPRTVSRATQGVIPFGQIPLVAVDDGGRVTMAWGSTGRERIRRFPDGGITVSGAFHVELALGSVATGIRTARPVVTGATLFDAQALGFATDAQGRPVLASSNGRRVDVIEIDPAAGAPFRGAARRLVARPATGLTAPGGSFSQPVVARGPDGRMAIGWTVNGTVVVAVRSPAGSWGRPVNVSRPAASAGDPRIAIGADGRVAVTWVAAIRTPRRGAPGHRSRIVLAAQRGPGGVWEAPQRLTATWQVPNDPRISIDGRGRTLIVMALGTNGFSGRASTVRYASRGATDTSWTEGGALSPAGAGPLFPRAATNAAGAAAAVWSRCTTRTSTTLEVATRAPDAAAWSPVTRFTAP